MAGACEGGFELQSSVYSPIPKNICSLSFNLTRLQVTKFLRNVSLRSRHLRRKSLEVLCDQNPTLILKIRDRKSAIKCRASRDFFPTCLLPSTRHSHGRHSPHFACLLALFTLALIACLLQLCVKTSYFDYSIWATPK